MEGCDYYEKDRQCGDCEHWDGKECRSGEKKQVETEARKWRKKNEEKDNNRNR